MEVAIARTVLHHPVMHSGIVDINSRTPAFVKLDRVDLSKRIEWKELSSPSAYDKAFMEGYKLQLDTKFPILDSQPLWRVLVLSDSASGHLDVMFAWNHPMTDGMGATLFHENLLYYLNTPNHQGASLDCIGPLLETPKSIVNFPRSQDEICHYPITLRFAASTLWKELMPGKILRRPTAAASWAPIRCRPSRTVFRGISIHNVQLQSVLAACRINKTTLTGLLHSLVLLSLSLRLPRDRATAFLSQTTINMRPFMPSPAKRSEPDPSSTMANYFSIMYHSFCKDIVSKIRLHDGAASFDKNAQHDRDHLIWSVAAAVRRDIRQTQLRGTKNKLVGLMQFVPDWRMALRCKARGTRIVSWLVTNLGVLDGQSTPGPWCFDQAKFAISSEVVGAAIHVCPVTVKNKDLFINITWQEGVVDDQLGDQLVKDLGEWLGYFGKDECVKD